MNIRFKKIWVFIGVFLLGCNLISCATKTSTKTHPEEGYEGGFGGDGRHMHQNKE
ncbi:TPA: hypothetical protein KLD64_001209 [Legionella pneumophila]|nr:hypothetical protein [Legionella pneumophila]